MNNIKNRFFCFLGIVMFVSASYPFTYKQEKSLFPEETEKFLLTAEVVSIEKHLEIGRTNFWKVLLNDGKKELKAIFKYVNRSRPSLFSDSYKYEIAAYKVNKILGINLVPPVVERKINGQTGSLQIMIENVLTDRNRKIQNIEPEKPDVFKNDIDTAKIFEILVNDQCNDSEDILIQKDDWKVWRVDFSEAFSPSSDILLKCKIERCPKILYTRLLELDENELIMLLDSYLNEKEIHALLERKQLIVKTIDELIKQNGENQVLF